MRLRPYQESALHDIAEHLNAGRRSVCLVMPTGAGKTATSAAWLTGHSGIRNAPMRHRESGLWVVHRVELLRQAFESLNRLLPGQVAIIRSGSSTAQYLAQEPRIYVATIQTLLASGERPEVKRIVCDECHHFVADNEWTTLLAAYPEARILGPTATPERKDGRALGDIFEALVVGARYPELVAAGHLVPCRAYAPPESINRGVANDPVAMYRRFGESGQGFLFTGSIASADLWADRFTAAGVPTVAVHQRTGAKKRADVMERFARGQIQILSNVYVLTEGVDVPAARVCILARAVPHVGNYLQMAGRVLRPAAGKRDAILIDLCGSILEHGLPTEDRSYSLNGRAIKRTTDSVRQCPRCGAVHEGQPTCCDICNYEWAVEPAEAPPPPRIYDMELREVYAGQNTPVPAVQREFNRLVSVATGRDYSLGWVAKQFARLFGSAPTAWLRELPAELRKREYDKLAQLGAERGYKAGFAAARYREIFGCWPPWSWRQPEASSTTLEGQDVPF